MLLDSLVLKIYRKLKNSRNETKIIFFSYTLNHFNDYKIDKTQIPMKKQKKKNDFNNILF